MWTVNMTTIFLIFCISTWRLAASCSCYPRHSQEIFCSNHTDFVMKAVVLSGRNEHKQNLSKDDLHIFGKDYYNAYITKIFKGTSTLRGIFLSSINDTFNPRHQKAVIYTASSSGTCGVPLKKGVKYLLSGSITQGRIEISTCDWIAPYHSISRQQRAGIKGEYDCGCKLKKCTIERQCDVADDECDWSGRFATKSSELECDLKHRMCKKLKGKCLWFEDSYFEPCIMETAFNMQLSADVKKYNLNKPSA